MKYLILAISVLFSTVLLSQNTYKIIKDGDDYYIPPTRNRDGSTTQARRIIKEGDEYYISPTRNSDGSTTPTRRVIIEDGGYYTPPVRSGINEGDAPVFQRNDNSNYFYEMGRADGYRKSKEKIKEKNTNIGEERTYLKKIKYYVGESELVVFDYDDLYSSEAMIRVENENGYYTIISCMNLSGKKTIFTLFVDEDFNQIGSSAVVGEQVVLGKGSVFELSKTTIGQDISE
jgi:hypothetical protein